MNFGFTQGSLLKRTLLHVVVFVGASAAFITAVSFVSVRVARAALAPAETTRSASSTPAESDATPADPAAAKSVKPTRGALRNRATPRLNTATRAVGKDG